ncbi:MAG: TolC family protein [Deltaproteobacteria bacterium]
MRAIAAVSLRFCRAGILLSLLLAGCTPWNRPEPLPPELTEAGVHAYLRIPKGQDTDLAKTMDKLNGRGNQSVLPAPGPDHKPKASAFSLADAIVFARRHSPRLRSARAAIERASGQKQVAFAPFLPQFTLGTDYGATSYNLGPGGPGPTGFIMPKGLPGTHSYYQETLSLVWTIYDFGRRVGRYQEAIARKKITELQLVRADQTVQFDVAVAYLNILLSRASLLVQEEAIHQAQATLKDARALWKGGVATPDNVLRAEVHLSESRDAHVRAREAELVATARLNTAMGRNAALPLKVYDLKFPPRQVRPSLAESLEIAAAQRPEIGFARYAVVAAQENLVATKAEFYPLIEIRASHGRIDGERVTTGWQQGAGLHLILPLFTGGARLGQLRTAKADVAAAVADAQSILDRVSLEVSQAIFSEAAAHQRLELSRTAVAEAKENLRIIRVKYRNGDATPTDIVDAETALTRSQQRFNSALYTYLASLAGLDYAMGRQQGTILRQASIPGETSGPSPKSEPGLVPPKKVK